MPDTATRSGLPGGLEANFRKESYLDAVRKAKEYIAAGDIYHFEL